MENNNPTKFLPRRWLMIALMIVLFVGALGIRLIDLTDLPNNFYMVRQYHSLIIARGMYYEHLASAPDWQRKIAVAEWKDQGLVEPPIMESLTALTYDLIGEHIWVGRVYASLFWLLGGLAIWLVAKEMSMLEGGILAMAYFLFIPFGMTASQAFMPDSLMTALIAWAFWGLYRWEMRRTWKSAILAGILTGVAILVKSVAVFPLLGAAAGLMISRRSWKHIIFNKQTWTVAGITALPTIIFYIYGMFIIGTLSGQFSLRFTPVLLKDPSFYGRWLFIATDIVGFAAMFLSLVGIILFCKKEPRFMLLGALVGYIVFGFAFPYFFITHEYYHLPLIPIIAIGLIPVADLVIREVVRKNGWFWRFAVVGLLLFGVAMKMWEERNSLVVNNYRSEIPYWQELGQLIGHDKNVVELSGDYGFRLAYFGWINGSQWLTNADIALRTLAGQPQPNFAKTFAAQTAGKDLFVITSPSEWDNQTELKNYLTAHYPLVRQGDSYWIFNLKP